MIPLPSKPKIVLAEHNRAIFEIEGLYPGYGQTIGNSMRRVLLSSLEGSVITSVKIEGVGHEFTSMEGVMEDIVELILNLKQMRFKLHESGPFMISLSVKGEHEVTGSDFNIPSQVEVVTPDVHIATLTSKKSSIVLEAVVETGRGYVPVEQKAKEKVEIGTIALDAAFSPVRHVNYEVEDMRVADRTDYNRLRINLETDGSVTPQEAFQHGAEILVSQFGELAQGFAKEETASEVIPQGVLEPQSVREEATSEQEEDFMKIKLDTLKLSSRTLNALREAGIKTISGIARKREESLREIDGLGEKGIQEIKKALGNYGITLKQ